MPGKNEIKWLEKPADTDYDAAETYLSLLYKPRRSRRLSRKLRAAKMSQFAAKDILRASATPMSEVSAFDWTRQQKEIERGDPLSPILIVRQGKGRQLLVADGFHRLCALFVADERVRVPCKIV
jgi:hypothetical protein